MKGSETEAPRDPRGDVLDHNLGLLLRHAYVPALPDPGFRQRLLQTLEIETRRLARRRIPAGGLDASVVPVPAWRRAGAVLAAAAAVLLLAYGTLVALRGDDVQLGRAELLARGDVAVRVGDSGWRAAGPDELAKGLPLGVDPLSVETPAARAFTVTTRGGRLEIEPASLARAAIVAPGVEELRLISGQATYNGTDGRIALDVGGTLRLVEGRAETAEVALASPGPDEERRPLEEAVEPEEDPAVPNLATLGGNVRAADGEPAGDFRVGLLRQRIGNDYHGPETREFENGTFVWEGIRPGRYRIYVSAEGHALLDLGWFDLTDEHGIDARLARGGTLRGHVIDRRTGNPVPDALVLSEQDVPQDGLLLSADADDQQWLPVAARTLADGSFELAHVNAGRSSLRVNAESYGALWIDDLPVVEGEATDGISLVLNSAGAVEGRVTNADGSPRVGEQIIVAIMNDERRPLMNFAVSETDFEGRYRVEDLPARMMFVIQVEQRFDAIPVVKPVEIVAGETVVVDFLGDRPGTRVFGRVTDAEGTPLAHHNIALLDEFAQWSDLPEDFDASTTLSDGSFVFEAIEPGDYLLYLVEDMGRWIRLVDRFEVPDWPELERPVTVADLEVGGRILDADTGQPVAACGIVLELFEDGRSLFAGNALTDHEGHYRIDLLNPGSYRVTAYPTQPGRGFLKSAPLVIDESSPSAEVEIELPQGATVEVHVVDPEGAPIAGATVLFEDDAGEGYTLAQFPVTDQRGVFRAVGVRTGELRVRAGLPGYEGPPVPFRCRPNQANRVELTLVPIAPPDAGEER